MKKNVMMRVASALLVAVLMTTCAISGTFAKYTTTVSSSDGARVANWGFERTNTMDLSNLFLGTYEDGDVKSQDGKDVIAPGAEGKATFSFAYDEKNGSDGPEVAYTFTVDVQESCAQAIKENENIQWKLDAGEWGTWDAMVAAIKALSGEADGSKDYAANTLPDAFGTADTVHTISWQWIFNTSDAADIEDTDMGNADTLANCSIQITITATQRGD